MRLCPPEIAFALIDHMLEKPQSLQLGTDQGACQSIWIGMTPLPSRNREARILFLTPRRDGTIDLHGGYGERAHAYPHDSLRAFLQ
jgi:hypothetical protein